MSHEDHDRPEKRPYEAPKITDSYDDEELRDSVRPQCGSLPDYHTPPSQP